MKQAADFKHYIRIIGRGQRAGRTLTQKEAFDAMTMLINGQTTAEQKGAFLMLLRVREETAEELAGFTQAFRQHSLSELEDLKVDLDMGCYAGKRRHLPWFLLSVMILAQQGKRIFLHGTHEPDSNRLYLSDVLPALGLAVANTTQQAAEQLEQFGFSYLPLQTVNPNLDSLIQLRAQFGLRSCANTLARMLNPSKAAHSLQGVFHRHVDEKHRSTAALLNDPNVLCFRGEGGEIEYNPERDVALHISRAGQQDCIELGAIADQWVTKPKILNPKELIAVWQGDGNPYADHSVIGTLAIMLILTEQIGWLAAKQRAEKLWANRDHSWPLNDIRPVASALYDTQGKHYAH